jgi:hypothetical protein
VGRREAVLMGASFDAGFRSGYRCAIGEAAAVVADALAAGARPADAQEWGELLSAVLTGEDAS